jgi:large subunit ribosomal protein L18
MTKTSTFRTAFRRRAEGRTNYVKRMAFVKSGKPRAVIRKSTNHMGVQFVTTLNGKDSIMAAAHTKELAQFHYAGHGGNIPAAYLTGLLAGTRMKGKAESVIVDLGVQPSIHGTRLYAAVKGIQDAGVSVMVDAVALPKEDRLHGKHVDAYAKHESSKTHARQFSTYSSKKINTAEFSKAVENAKKAILEGGNQ